MGKKNLRRESPYRLSDDEHASEEAKLRRLVESKTAIPCTKESIKRRSQEEGRWAAIISGAPWMVIFSILIELLLKRLGLLPELVHSALRFGGPVCMAFLISLWAFYRITKRSRRKMERESAAPAHLLVAYYTERLCHSRVEERFQRVVQRASSTEGAISDEQAQLNIGRECEALGAQLALHVRYCSVLLARLRTEMMFWSLLAERPRIVEQVLVTTAELDERLAALDDFEECIPSSVNTALAPVDEAELKLFEGRIALLPTLPRLVQNMLQEGTNAENDDEFSGYLTKDIRKRWG